MEKFCDFEGYFDDLSFEKGTYTHYMVKAQTEDHKESNAGWEDVTLDPPDELQYFSPTMFTYKISVFEDENTSILLDPKLQMIQVDPSHVDDDISILHIMIHMYEFSLRELPLFFHDAILWALYNNLRKKIIGLEDLLTEHSHLINGPKYNSYAGSHDMLFLLKSLDIDIRLGKPLGTVYGYDTAKFAECVYVDNVGL